MASQGRAGGPESTLSRISGRVPSDRGTTRNVSASPMISGQRLIAVHALENLATSDTGIAILRRTLREQNQASERRPRSDECGSGGALQRKNIDECVEHDPVARRGIDVSKGGGMRAKYRTMVGGLSSVVVVGLLSGQEEAAVRH